MIGVLSDAHGNICAFRQAVKLLTRLGANKFYFLGDSVGYIPTTEVLRELYCMGDTVKCIKGNHEVELLDGSLDSPLDDIYQHQRVRNELTADLVAFIRSWPNEIMEEQMGTRILFVHGGPSNHINQYVYYDTDLSLYSMREDYMFMGHTHYPFIRQVGATVFVNVGSCGLPRDDGRFGSAALFNPIDRMVKIIRFSIEQEIQTAFSDYGPVHPMVMALRQRRSSDIIGELV